ncbi:hypothetical protein ACFQX6_32460 [Streptosporangium lutulentum]
MKRAFVTMSALALAASTLTAVTITVSTVPAFGDHCDPAEQGQSQAQRQQNQDRQGQDQQEQGWPDQPAQDAPAQDPAAQDLPPREERSTRPHPPGRLPPRPARPPRPLPPRRPRTSPPTSRSPAAAHPDARPYAHPGPSLRVPHPRALRVPRAHALRARALRAPAPDEDEEAAECADLGPFPEDFIDIRQVQRNFQEVRTQRRGSSGTFTSRCGRNENRHHNSDNFIVAPGVSNGAHHVHDYVGNLSTDGFSTDQSLAAAGTTCALGDRSTYFWPVLRDRTNDTNADDADGNVGSIMTPAR